MDQQTFESCVIDLLRTSSQALVWRTSNLKDTLDALGTPLNAPSFGFTRDELMPKRRRRGVSFIFVTNTNLLALVIVQNGEVLSGR